MPISSMLYLTFEAYWSGNWWILGKTRLTMFMSTEPFLSKRWKDLIPRRSLNDLANHLIFQTVHGYDTCFSRSLWHSTWWDLIDGYSFLVFKDTFCKCLFIFPYLIIRWCLLWTSWYSSRFNSSRVEISLAG